MMPTGPSTGAATGTSATSVAHKPLILAQVLGSLKRDFFFSARPTVFTSFTVCGLVSPLQIAPMRARSIGFMIFLCIKKPASAGERIQRGGQGARQRMFLR